MFSIHYTADDSNRVYTCVTDKEYPPRIAFAMLEEMQTKFLTKVTCGSRVRLVAACDEGVPALCLRANSSCARCPRQLRARSDVSRGGCKASSSLLPYWT